MSCVHRIDRLGPGEDCRRHVREHSLSLPLRAPLSIRGFQKLGVPYLGILLVRILSFGLLYWVRKFGPATAAGSFGAC